MNDKYRWHDLLANPEELPDDREVLVYDGVYYATATYRHSFVFGWVSYDDCVNTSEIIAWRYFEPFGGDLL